MDTELSEESLVSVRFVRPRLCTGLSIFLCRCTTNLNHLKAKLCTRPATAQLPSKPDPVLLIKIFRNLTWAQDPLETFRGFRNPKKSDDGNLFVLETFRETIFLAIFWARHVKKILFPFTKVGFKRRTATVPIYSDLALCIMHPIDVAEICSMECFNSNEQTIT